MFAKISGVISTIISIVGVIAFFSDSIVLLYWCAAISIVNSLVQTISGEQNNLSTEVVTVFIFSIVSFFTKTKWIIMIAFGLCLVDALMSLIGWIANIILISKNRF